jgi:type II secretory pathway pseudopilin PulG
MLPVPPLQRSPRTTAGFSLMEVLAIVAVLMVLMGIGARVGSGVAHRSREATARSQMAALASALASYKLHYGDYPQTERAEDLYDALTGRLGPKITPLNPPGKAFLTNLGRFSLSTPANLGVASGLGSNTLLDPWGNPYNYVYKVPAGGGWTNPNFVLFSDGPDGKHKTPVKDAYGFPKQPLSDEDTDNIYESELR